MNSFRIIDLPEKYVPLYCVCLEDWSEEIKEAGNHKREWYEKMKDIGLGVKLALSGEDVPAGMIQYYPIQYSPARGENLYFIQCVWVHGYKKGRGNFQKKGMGSALLEAAEQDIRERGAGGAAAWGVSLPFWMRAAWFKKHGYVETDRRKQAVLLWRRFKDDAQPPEWRKPGKEIPGNGPDGKVQVTGFVQGVCPAMNIVFERSKRAAEELKDKVTFLQVDTSEPEVLDEWGIADGIYLAGKEMRTGPPPSYRKIKKRIIKAAGR